MKQHITLKQLNELSEKAKNRLRKWWKPSNGDIASIQGWTVVVGCFFREDQIQFIYENTKKDMDVFPVKMYVSTKEIFKPLLSIGQMIEFLEEHTPKECGAFEHWLNIIACYTNNDDGVHPTYEGEICDALWEAVKEVLEND